MADEIHISDPMSGAELVWEIERRFGVRLNPHRVAGCRTVGDLYSHLLEILGPEGGGLLWVASPDQGPQDTPALMALWRIRQSLHRLYPGTDVRAGTPLDDVGADLRRPSVLARLEELSGLTLPKARLHPALVAAPTLPGLLLAWHFGTAPLIIAGGLVALLGYAFGELIGERLLHHRFAKLPRSIRTVEDLAKAAGLLSIGTLRRDGGRIPERWLWAAYADCVRGVLGMSGPVQPHQRFQSW